MLPLANLSGDQGDDYFGIGLAEEITRALAKNGVRVIGRVSAGALQAKGLDERAIARELGVGSLLTGTVQRAEGQIRISVALLSAGDGAVRWSEKYDRPLANVFAVQDEIARTVAATLLGTLRAPPGAAPARAETADPEAHALFLQGLVLFNRRGAGSLQQAVALFQRAAARDPKYARAQAALAMALAVLPAYVQDSTTPLVTSAVAAAQRAIAMDSTIPESYAALGYAYSLLGELRPSGGELPPRPGARLHRGLHLGLVRVARQPAGRLPCRARTDRAGARARAGLTDREGLGSPGSPPGAPLRGRRFGGQRDHGAGFHVHAGLDLAGERPAGDGTDR